MVSNSARLNHNPGTSGTLPAISGIFFMYDFLVSDPEKGYNVPEVPGKTRVNAGTRSQEIYPGLFALPDNISQKNVQ
jgi:hypothetical protein